MFRVLWAMLAKWSFNCCANEDGKQAAREILDAIIDKAIGNITTEIQFPQCKPIQVEKGKVHVASLKSELAFYEALAGRFIANGVNVISFSSLLVECFTLLSQPSRQKVLLPGRLQPMIAAMVELVSLHMDFTRHEQWLDQSALVLAPSPRGKKVERVSQLYKHELAHKAATAKCRVDANTGWFE